MQATTSPTASTSVASLSPEAETLAVNTLRFLAVDMVQKADSGHPGLPLDAAPMAYVLWTRFLRHNPANPKWWDRDRFILSAGHGSALLYSLLHLTGYDLPMDQIKQFRQWDSLTPGHPERGLTPGVEITTGPLGQGFANAVGMAVAEAHLAARFNRPDHDLIQHWTYTLVSDGDLMEGIASEAASLAGTLQLGKLIALYDQNHISLAGSTNLTFTEDVAARFQAYGWQTISVEDGNDLKAIESALNEARQETERPSLILVHTILGYGSPNKQNTFAAHGSPLGEEEVRLTKKNLGWPSEDAFYVPEETGRQFREALERGKHWETDWNQRLEAYRKAYPDLAKELEQTLKGELPSGWDSAFPTFPADAKGLATRISSGQILNAIAQKVPALMGGSADLNPSTNTALKGLGDFGHPKTDTEGMQGLVGGGVNYAGRNIAFGVREHAMAAMVNGMAAHGGVIPYSATFFTFSDYMRPSIRLGALMELPSLYIFTHDSIGLGEDGPTHQPVEQLAALRAIPHLLVLRPGDANEAAEAWRAVLQFRDEHGKQWPAAFVLSRQNLPTLDRSKVASAEGVRHGAYVLSDPTGDGPPNLILIATGSEVHLALEAQAKLQEQGVRARVVSMPSWELFNRQPDSYRESVLPKNIRARLSIEAASPMGWHRYVGDGGDIIGIDHFGASAPGPLVMEKYGFSVENVCKRALSLLKQA